jgi:twinkle protein
MSGDLLAGDALALSKRGISEETCRKFRYWVGKDHHGKVVQIANYCDEAGVPVAQKVRYADKTFAVLGDKKQMGLFGQHLWKGSGRRIVVTEGELDALSVAEATGRTWDVVSLPNGADGARKALQRALEWLLGYETVVLAFDQDEPGREAVAACADLFPPGRCAVASFGGFKDANEQLVAGQVRELNVGLWNAKPYRPDGIVTAADIRERVLAPPEVGLPYAIESLNQHTYGRRIGDVIGFGAGTGVGKTDLLTQMIAYDVDVLKQNVGVLFLEQDVGETGKRIAGKLAHKRFHVRDGSWSDEEFVKTWDRVEKSGRLHLYDSFGVMDWESVRAKIRFMHHSLGCNLIYFDHVTAVVAGEDDERKALDRIMGEAAGDAKGNYVLHYVSHLATPEGRSHERGGRVESKHFRGSRALAFWSYFMWGIERDKQADDPAERCKVTLRCIKDRYTGDCEGRTFKLTYERASGVLTDHGEFTEGDASTEFSDESDREF